MNPPDLSLVRESLHAPTLLAARLATALGTEPVAIRHGCVDAVFPGTTNGVSLTVRLINVYRATVKTYARYGLPIPPGLIERMERWDREHGLG